MIDALLLGLGLVGAFVLGYIAISLSWDGPDWFNRLLGVACAIGAAAVMTVLYEASR